MVAYNLLIIKTIPDDDESTDTEKLNQLLIYSQVGLGILSSGKGISGCIAGLQTKNSIGSSAVIIRLLYFSFRLRLNLPR